MTEPVLITVVFGAYCLSCEEPVEAGDQAHWILDVGVWHRDCPEPHNLASYVKEANTKRGFPGAR